MLSNGFNYRSVWHLRQRFFLMLHSTFIMEAGFDLKDIAAMQTRPMIHIRHIKINTAVK